jgi:hypothetical protein
VAARDPSSNMFAGRPLLEIVQRQLAQMSAAEHRLPLASGTEVKKLTVSDQAVVGTADNQAFQSL